MNQWKSADDRTNDSLQNIALSIVTINNTISLILNELTDSIKSLNNLITGLVNRIDTMNNDIVKIDTLISVAFNKKPNLERLAAADGKEDSRKD